MEVPSYSGDAKKYEGPCQCDPGKEPSTVCPYLPGSREKVFFLQSRVEAGERLWHENDLTLDEEAEIEALEENVFDLLMDLMEVDDEDND